MAGSEVKTRGEADARERLLVAAGELFCRRGYHAVGTQEICEKAKVLKGTFYHFFPSKIDLALVTLDRFATAAREEFLATATAELPAETRIVNLFELDRAMVARQKREHGRVLGCMYGNFVLELAAAEPKAAERLEAITRDWATAIQPAISAALGDKGQRKASALSKTILAMIQGSVVLAKALNDPDLVTQQGQAAVCLLKSLSPSTKSTTSTVGKADRGFDRDRS